MSGTTIYLKKIIISLNKHYDGMPISERTWKNYSRQIGNTMFPICQQENPSKLKDVSVVNAVDTRSYLKFTYVVPSFAKAGKNGNLLVNERSIPRRTQKPGPLYR